MDINKKVIFFLFLFLFLRNVMVLEADEWRIVSIPISFQPLEVPVVSLPCSDAFWEYPVTCKNRQSKLS